MLRGSALAAVGLLSSTCMSEMIPCTYEFSTPKATFDLSALYLEDKTLPYKANDTYLQATSLARPFTYFFNVCGDVGEPDEVAMCHKNFTGSKAAAWQHVAATDINGNKEECWSLGRAESPKWKYISGDNAAVGVQLIYQDGSPCRDAVDKKRQFVVELSCIHEATALPFISTVYEDDYCEYKVTMESIYGCPQECHTSNHDKVCGGHGICAVDTTTKQSRCFCNAGFGGEDCLKTVASDTPVSSSPVGTLMTLVCLLLIALLALSGVLYLRIKKLNADDNPYGAFEDQVPHSAMDS